VDRSLNLPSMTNVLARIYWGIRQRHPALLQRFLWDFDVNVQEDRANEIVIACLQALDEEWE
jgi:hypothetical protein